VSLVAFARVVYHDAVASLREKGAELVFSAAGRYDATTGTMAPIQFPDSLKESSGAKVHKFRADAGIRRALKACDANTIIVCRDVWVSEIVGVRPRDAADRREAFKVVAEIAGLGMWRGFEVFSRIGNVIFISDAMPPLEAIDNGESWFQS
jgi:hypothetical protein